jgi:imidazolonepropionase-like amidohydrolase
MGRRELLACGVIVGLTSSAVVLTQPRGGSKARVPVVPVVPVVYEGARLIIGDGRAPIENGALVVENGRIRAVGRKGAVAAPAGATRVNLTGKTVMPALINAHIHIGYEGYTSWSADNYTASNVADHLRREAYYGIAAALSVGGDPNDQAIRFQQEQQAGKFPGTARFLFAAGMAPPGGGPDSVLIKGTAPLHAVYDVSNEQEARAAVETVASKKIKFIKIWVDDRRGTYPKMQPAAYRAVVAEAHKRQIMVFAHATTLEDGKAVLRAGVDLIVHLPYDKEVDDEYLALLKERNPYYVPIIGFFDRSPVCEDDPFVDQVLPAKVVTEIRATRCQQRAAAPGGAPSFRDTLQQAVAYNFPKIAANARVVLGTDAGVVPGYSFGWAEHHELERYVELGMTPSQAITVATERPAALLGVKDLGTLTVGKSADFLVLNANPLDNIRNLRQIASFYMRGNLVDRDALRGGFNVVR